MEFSSLVLMEIDPVTKMFIKELDSFEVNEGAEYIKKMYCMDGEITVYFDTIRDVEEWEYSAVFDLFKKDNFLNNGFKIEDYDEEFNPTWIVNFKYSDDYEINKGKINVLCNFIRESMEQVFTDIKGRKDEYI